LDGSDSTPMVLESTKNKQGLLGLQRDMRGRQQAGGAVLAGNDRHIHLLWKAFRRGWSRQPSQTAKAAAMIITHNNRHRSHSQANSPLESSSNSDDGCHEPPSSAFES
jgi:hypothetical protein